MTYLVGSLRFMDDIVIILYEDFIRILRTLVRLNTLVKVLKSTLVGWHWQVYCLSYFQGIFSGNWFSLGRYHSISAVINVKVASLVSSHLVFTFHSSIPSSNYQSWFLPTSDFFPTSYFFTVKNSILVKTPKLKDCTPYFKQVRLWLP